MSRGGNRPPAPPPVQAQIDALRSQQAQLFADLAQGQQRFRRLARSVWRIQEDERRRFARDLHDGLGQNITAIVHQLEQLAGDPALPRPAAVRAERALDLCLRALHDTRHLARMLRPKILDDLGLCAALSWLGRSVSEGAGFAVDVDCEEDFPDPDGDLATLVFRVVQEALNNAAKHAHARHVLVTVGSRAGELHLLVADDGRGCDPDAALSADTLGAGTGIGSMRERVELFGGRLHLVSAPGDGTQVRAALPLREAAPG
jgi:signal transduction histidine kinase